jgi:uronate dehydrogenase
MSMIDRRRVLVTGAAGRLGRAVVEDLGDEFDFCLFDRHRVDGWPTMVVGDVMDPPVLDGAMTDVDVVVHLAADASAQASFANVRAANIDGTYEVFEAARRNGVGKVVFASSNRVVEMASPLRRAGDGSLAAEPEPHVVRVSDPIRPDTLYGASKAFGEALAAYYADVHGIASVCLRLGSVDVATTPTIEDKPRAWALWLSRRDLVGLVRAALRADVQGCVVAFASSANTRRWWDLSATVTALGYEPVDDSERWLHDGHRGGLVPPAPTYLLPWSERLVALARTSGAGHVHLVALGQSGFWICAAGARLAIDPFLTVYPDRLQPPLLAPVDLPVEHVLVTHTHRDHLDAPALTALARARPDVAFVGPPTVVARLTELGIEAARITTLLPGQSTTLGTVEVRAVPARHRPTTPDAQGYVLHTTAGTMFHTGDTELDPCLLDAATARPDVLLVPINGRKGNMTAEQAAELAGQLSVPVVVPMHYGCLQPVDDLLDRFLESLARVAPGSRPALMDPGSIALLPFRPAT